jgi:hypothetical protein
VCSSSDVVFVAFVALVQHLLNFKSLGRSNLMHHGFTAKQSSWILTSLEEGLGGGTLVSLLQLRNAVLPVLQVTLILPRRYVSSVAARTRYNRIESCLRSGVRACGDPSVRVAYVCMGACVRARAHACLCLCASVSDQLSL